MRPSVSQLLSWRPDQLGAAGQDLLTRAADLQRSAGDLTSIGSGLSGVWSGAAAQAATAHHHRRSAEVDDLATVVHTAGRALLHAGEDIGQARTRLQSALSAASAAGCTVLDDGAVLPPARPPVPVGLSDEHLTAWQTQADATATAQAAGAARLAQQIRAALAAAGAADATSSAALSALRPPQISPPPQPVTMGLTGGQWAPLPLPTCPTISPASAVSPAQGEDEDDDHWWDEALHQAKGFGTGLWDGVSEPVAAVGGLVGLNGDVSDNWSALGSGLKHGVTHPLDFGKAMINWEDLAAGEYGHWVGELAPSVAAAFFTGGATAAVKGVSGATALQRAGMTAKDVARLTDAEAAQVIMRGARETPGMVHASGPLRPGVVIAEPLTPSGLLAAERGNFTGPITVQGPVLSERWLAQASDATVPLRGTPEASSHPSPRSLRYNASPRDLLAMPDAATYAERFALDPSWGARDQVSVLHVPDGSGTPGHAFVGATAPQGALAGGGTQTLLYNVNTTQVVWTGPPPWASVTDLGAAAQGAAVAGSTFVGMRAGAESP